MRSYYTTLSWALNPVTCVLFKRIRQGTETETLRRHHHGKDMHRQKKDSHVTMDADVEVMNSKSRNAKDWQQ